MFKALTFLIYNEVASQFDKGERGVSHVSICQ